MGSSALKKPKSYRRMGEQLAQVRLSRGFDQTPDRAVFLYEIRHKTKLSVNDARAFKRGWRRGRLMYWLKRVFSISTRMNAKAINDLVRVLERYSQEKITREYVGMAGTEEKIADYLRQAETFEGLEALNTLLLQRLDYHVYHEPWRKVYQWVLYRGEKALNDYDHPVKLEDAAPLFYDDLKAAILLGEGNEHFRLRYHDGQWGCKAGARDENHRMIEVNHSKPEIAILIALLMRTE